MKLGELPRFWVDTFLKPGKEMNAPDAKLGIASALIAAVIIGVLNFALAALAGGATTAKDILLNVAGLPVAVLALVFAFSLLVRRISSLYGGKGTLNGDLGIIGVFAGSLTFVGGLFFMLFGPVLGGYVNYLFSSSLSFSLLMGYSGLMFGVFALLFFLTYSAWLRWLAEAEGIDATKMGVAIAISVGVLVLAAMVVYGIYTDMTVGPYLDELKQLQALQNLTVGA